MSHIATEEWQSFELRMRRRRAERMLLHAQAALDAGCLDDARVALDEARRLSPGLPQLQEVEDRIAVAAAPVIRPPVAAARRSLTAAASLVLLAVAALVGWRVLKAPPASPRGASSVATAGPSATAPKPAPAAPSPSIRIETEQVPPVVVSGSQQAPDEAAEPPTPPPATMKSAALVAPTTITGEDANSHAVGTTGPTTVADAAKVSTVDAPKAPSPAAPAPVEAGIDVPLGNATALPPPEPPGQRTERAVDVARESGPPPSLPAADRAPTEPSPSLPKKTDDVALVRSILNRYADAYTRLDADAAKAVWPSVNRTALARAFDGLNEQRIAFSDCSVLVRSTEARATCSGSATWEPKIGGGARTDVRRWAFALEKSGDEWIIRDARVQNR